MAKSGDILEVIRREYDHLSPQLKLAARFALDSPDSLALHSMREIAVQADVLPPTMTRLAKRLGFDTYHAFRNKFRERIAPPPGSYAARARQLQLRNALNANNGFVEEMSNTEMSNIVQTFEPISDEEMAAAAQTFIDANQIYIVGLRKCFPISYFFHYATRSFFPSAKLVQGQAGMFSEEIAHITRGDVVFAVAYDPYTRETVMAAKKAKKSGAKLVVITDSVVSPLADGADHVFLVANRSPSFYRSLVGALALVQSMVAAIVNELGVEAVKRLEISEKRLRENDTYWQGGDKN
ncbi:MAG: MurR/RpiR family transcriptional regulator [Proteobacteria bacterium]|nr:MurR/RpiR family transcriptional regulator [Pseudomonadota bacterium]